MSGDKPVTEDLGIAYVHKVVATMGYLWREKPKHDVGIDGEIEVKEAGEPTGKLIGVQIKTGDSYFREETADVIRFRPNLRHLRYWAGYALPVILILYKPSEEAAYWCDVKSYITDHPWLLEGKRPLVIEVPKAQRFVPASKERLREIAYAALTLPEQTARQPGYTILRLDDISHASAKRYRANILVDRAASREEIKAIICTATAQLRECEEHRSCQVARRWAGRPAHVVALFIYRTLDDMVTANWVCASMWIGEHLPAEYRPLGLPWDEEVDGIGIYWSPHYQALREWARAHTATKGQVLAHIDALLPEISELVGQAITLTRRYEQGEISQQSYHLEMGMAAEKYHALYLRGSDFPFPPIECRDLDLAFQRLLNTGHDVFLPFTEQGLQTWTDEGNRMWLLHDAIRRYEADRQALVVERAKFR